MSVGVALILLCGLQFTVEYFFRQHLHKTRGMMMAGNRSFRERVFYYRTDSGQLIPTQGEGPILHVAGEMYDPGARKQARLHTAKDSLTGVVYAEPAGPFPMGGPFRERGMFIGFFSMVLMNTLSSGVIILLLGGFIKLANSLWVSEKQKKALETERLNAELNFLKLQINPHFLFNTLNSIYSQAHLKSEQTEHSILKFSQIMRYVLYDSTTEKIPLSRDIEYIRNYIDLQKLRLSKNVTIQYEVSGISEELLIPPLLLITFIENAFKHGISYTSPSAINIKIAVIGNELLLTVGNTIVKKREDPGEKSAGGVGLTNARRRLDVLYPGRYELEISDNKSIYVVNLKIVLNHETELHHH
jgi:LytS/YehU family sensor histidine kinase